MSELDPTALRRAFGTYMTGVTVVTTLAEDGTPVGFTANSFTSVSLNPPLLLVCPGNHLSSYEIFKECENFAISILADGQEEVSNTFASSSVNRFNLVDCTEDNNGIPLIAGATASFSCKAHEKIECGDHFILVGRVLEFAADDKPGLGYSKGGYFSLAKERLTNASPAAGRSVRVGAIIEHDELVYVVRDGEQVSLPSIDVPADKGARSAIESYLKELGLMAKVGRVYSVFDDAKSGEKLIYFTASLNADPTVEPHNFLTLSEILQSKWPSNAITVMMNRYLEERGNMQFGLYIGNSEVGEVLHDNRV